MVHHKKPPRNPLFTDENEANLFMSLFNDFDDERHIKVAKAIFVEGLTLEEAAEMSNYDVRSIGRLKNDILKVILKRAIKRVLIQVPAADVEEVKHGYWELDMYCSVCGYLYDTGEYTNANDYCPKCGAKMNGERKDT